MVENVSSGTEANDKPEGSEANPKEKEVSKTPRASSGAESARFASDREKIDELLQVDLGSVSKADVSASTIVKMMGVASATELKLVEGKLDLLAGRLGNLSIRLERATAQLNNIPSVSDFERIEGQLTFIRSMIKDLVQQSKGTTAREAKETKEKLQAYVQKNQATPESVLAAPAPVTEAAQVVVQESAPASPPTTEATPAPAVEAAPAAIPEVAPAVDAPKQAAPADETKK